MLELNFFSAWKVKGKVPPRANIMGTYKNIT